MLLIDSVSRRSPRLGDAARFRNQMPDDSLKIAGLLIDTQLALGAGAVFENGMDVFDGAAASEIVDDIIDKIEKFECEIAHGNFGFFAEVDELALDAVASGAPFVFFNQGAAVESVALVAFVKTMEFHDDGLGKSGNRDGFFDFGGDIEHTEFESAEHGVRTDVPPDFFAVVDAVQFDEEIDEILVGAPGLELLGNTGARETSEDGGTKRFQTGIASHPERRAGGEREKVREEIADHVHHVDGGLFVGHGDMNVHAEDQKGTSELLELLDNVFVAFAGGDDLVDPTGKWMSAGGGDLQSNAFGGGDELAARAVHFNAQLADVFADFGARLDDGLVHLAFYLFRDGRRGGRNQLHDVRTERAGGGVNDLELFFDTDGEAVSHGVALRMAVV
jgi:hypothetical protein